MRIATPHAQWPGPTTVLLLRAALARGDDARTAFADWLSASPLEIQALPRQEQRLLPLVAANLRRLGVEHPVVAVGAQMAEATAAANRRLLDGARAAVAELAARGVPVLVLKGIPLLLEHYRDLGLRPMTDVDLLVPAAHLGRALGALDRAGFRPKAPTPRKLLRYTRAFDLVGPGGMKLDLHQYLTEHGSTPAVERALFDRAHALDLGGAHALAPGPTDLLLNVCLAGMTASRFPNSRWIADAMLLLRGGRIDWAELVAEACQRDATVPLRECLQHLADSYDAAIPDTALGALWRRRESWAERRRYQVLTRYSASLPQLFAEYANLYTFGARAAGDPLSPLGFARFAVHLASHRMQLAGPSELPAAIVRSLAQRLKSARASVR